MVTGDYRSSGSVAPGKCVCCTRLLVVRLVLLDGKAADHFLESRSISPQDGESGERIMAHG
jgi:hypothetical protein